MILDESLNTEQYAIGFKKGNDELCEIVNADLQKLAEDGTVQELAEKYEIAISQSSSFPFLNPIAYCSVFRLSSRIIKPSPLELI